MCVSECVCDCECVYVCVCALASALRYSPLSSASLGALLTLKKALWDTPSRNV